MAGAIGNGDNPLRVAVFGAGPAGFYAVEELLKQGGVKVTVDLFDRLPTPYGLVRGGVAPDHQKIKAVIKQYEKFASRPGFRFFGNVTFGADLSLAEVLTHYHQVLFTTGAETDRRMGIPGEDLPGSFPATVFVWWYNGHPDCRDLQFDLSTVERVAVVGNGNVAMDVTRVLAKSADALASTDIADYALEVLRKSAVKEIYLLGRRGPAQAAFTNPEIRELAEIKGADLVVRPDELELDELSREFLAQAHEKTYQGNMDILTAQISKGEGPQPRKIRARFFVSPVAVLGTEHVEGVRLEKNRLIKDAQGTLKAQGTGEYEEIPVQMIFRSIGYKGIGLSGVPFDERNGIVPNRGGRVIDPDTQAQCERVYVAGWIKRGPSGVIGTNKLDAAGTVEAMLEDARHYQTPEGFQPDGEMIPLLLSQKGVRYVTFADWKRIDLVEIARGKKLGKPREKLTTLAEMLAAVREV
ncbi:MAG: FAD-dependent oxidoreductase [Candidatus Binatia bacterium]